MEAADARVEVEIRVPGDTRYLSLIGRIGEDLAHGLGPCTGDPGTLAPEVNQVLTEAAANAMEHGNGGDPARTVRVSLAVSGDELLIRVYDEGSGFDIERLPAPDPGRLEERGRGIHIIRSLVDSVACRPVEGGSVLELRKRLR